MRGQGDLPPIAGQFSGPLLVCASGRTLWSDLALAPAMAAVMAVNWAGCFMPRKIDHWASLHGDMLALWLPLHATWRSEGHIWSHSLAAEHDGVEHGWDFDPSPPCSGLFAALVGLALGYAPVILAGCPEDLRGHFYDPPGSPGSYTNNAGHLAVWRQARDTVFANRVRSLSGLTRELLGAPDGF